MGYLEDKVVCGSRFNTLITTQDDVSDIQRNDGGIGFRYFLPRDWNLGVDLDFFQNTEQSLDLRTTGKVGLENFFSEQTPYIGT